MFAPRFKKFAKVNAECWDLKHIKGHIKRHIITENLQPIEGNLCMSFPQVPGEVPGFVKAERPDKENQLTDYMLNF